MPPLFKSENISDFFFADKRIEEARKKGNLPAKHNIRIALLCSFTGRGIKEVLNVKCFDMGVLAEFYLAPYNQYMQEMLDKESPLRKFNPDLTIIFIDTRSILGEMYFSPYCCSGKKRKQIVTEKTKELVLVIKQLSRDIPGKIVFHNLELPIHSPLGILENKQENGFIEMVRNINTKLAEKFRNDNRVFIFDYDLFCSKHGKKNILDHKMYYLGDLRINFDLIPALCEEYMSFIKPAMSIARKCIVLDLDNTLWGGVLGEDGIAGIKLGPTPEGRPFLELQKYIFNLFRRGVILAANSHNNPSDVADVFRRHPHMVLKRHHFAAMRVNWDDKISNMKVIAQELNIGLESMVFIDDDRVNRELMKMALPEVLVVEMPDDPAHYLSTVMGLNDFNTFHITKEDVKKGRMYALRREREDFKKSSTDVEQYLKKLKIVATVQRANHLNIPRISQLTQKTNQFNMTTKRYSDEDIARFSKDRDFIVAAVKVKDRFGDDGITGVAIIKKNRLNWEIDSFLLSCRIFGRKIEHVLLAYLIGEAKKEKAKVLTGKFIPSSKNAPAKDFYRENGFKLIKQAADGEIWEFDLANDFKAPEIIRFVKE